MAYILGTEYLQSKTEMSFLHSKMKHIKFKDLFFYGFIHCDISNYEDYNIIELVQEFCDEVPTFFYSYDHLHLLFKHRFNEVNKAMVQLRADMLSYPAAPLQAKIARIIHMYYVALQWDI